MIADDLTVYLGQHTRGESKRQMASGYGSEYLFDIIFVALILACAPVVENHKIIILSSQYRFYRFWCIEASKTSVVWVEARQAGDHQCVTLHVPLTPDTKDSIDKEQPTKMPKISTLINAARPERVHETSEVLSARPEFRYLSDVPVRDNTDLKICREQSVVIMNTPCQNVNDDAELVFDMMKNVRA